MLVWSYGGGTQSIAIGLLILEGKLPRPDIIVMADTGLETTETWEYLWCVMMPLFYEAGLNVHIAGHELANVDLYSHKGRLLIPAYTKDGKLPTFCSSEWKTLVVRRYIGGAEANPGGVTMWLGMSTDEIERMKPSDVKWINHAWPLCGMPKSHDYGIRMNRIECKQYIFDQGKPEPPKSCCIICPHRRNPQWERQKKFYPEDHAKAVVIDKIVRDNDKRGGVWLHESRLPLDQVDFSKPDDPELFGCDSGICWT